MRQHRCRTTQHTENSLRLDDGVIRPKCGVIILRGRVLTLQLLLQQESSLLFCQLLVLAENIIELHLRCPRPDATGSSHGDGLLPSRQKLATALPKDDQTSLQTAQSSDTRAVPFVPINAPLMCAQITSETPMLARAHLTALTALTCFA